MKYIIAILASVSVLCGATVDFRGGRVLCAEFSLTAPAISGFVPGNYTDLPLDRIYAAVTVMCDEGRSLSIHDYGLDVFDKVYPCIAIRTNNGRFTATPDGVGRINPKHKYTLLFMADSKLVGLGDNETYILRARFASGKFAGQKIIFRTLGKKAFTAPGNIPVTGKMTVKK